MRPAGPGKGVGRQEPRTNAHIRLFATWTAQEADPAEIGSITPDGLARFLAAPEAVTRPDGMPKKVSSVNSLRSSLRGFFQYLHRAGTLEKDPSRMIRRALRGEPPPRTLSKRDQESLLGTIAKASGTAAKRDHALFLLLLRTGIRISSALEIEVTDVRCPELQTNFTLAEEATRWHSPVPRGKFRTRRS